MFAEMRPHARVRARSRPAKPFTGKSLGSKGGTIRVVPIPHWDTCFLASVNGESVISGPI